MISSTGRVCANTESIARATMSRRFQVGMMTEVSGMSAMAVDLVKRALYLQDASVGASTDEPVEGSEEVVAAADAGEEKAEG